jgi:hypothetical protein
MKRKALWLLALALATGSVAAGCGGDDDDGGDGGGDALSKEEFVAQGNEICTEGNAEIEAGAQEAFPEGQPTPETAEAFVNDTLVPSVQGQIDDLRDLGIPEGDEDQVTEILDKAELALQDLKEDPTLAIGQGEDPFAEVNQELTDYGLTACAG